MPRGHGGDARSWRRSTEVSVRSLVSHDPTELLELRVLDDGGGERGNVPPLLLPRLRLYDLHVRVQRRLEGRLLLQESDVRLPLLDNLLDAAYALLHVLHRFLHHLQGFIQDFTLGGGEHTFLGQ